MNNIDIPTLIYSFVLVFVILVACIFIFFIVFDRKKSKFLLEREQAKRAYEKELSESKIEIQEQILKNISWELHDNIGQMLSASKMQLSALGKQDSNNNDIALSDSIKILNDVILDIRQLSRTLNNDYIDFNGVVRSTELEIERFNRLKYVKATMTIMGEETAIDDKDEVILFRIIQELLSNIVKHSKATELNVSFDFREENLTIKVKDNGVGFNGKHEGSGIGMANLNNRVKMLNGSIQFINNNGLEVAVEYPYSLKTKTQ
jgi:hypothetical protein